jgi:hypothetical protein
LPVSRRLVADTVEFVQPHFTRKCHLSPSAVRGFSRCLREA